MSMMYSYDHIPSLRELNVAKETDEMVLFEPFILENPETEILFPPSDEPYYTALEMSLRHLLYKFSKGWITSERQVIFSSDECISTVHFLFNEKKQVTSIHVFQRSSNVINLYDDVQFFNHFINKYCESSKVDLKIFVSMPHRFKGKLKKIED